MDIDKALVIPLFGTIGCHECGQMGQWFVNGATLPCKCGIRNDDELEGAIEYVRRYKDILAMQQQRAQMARESEARRIAEAQRKAEEADTEKLNRVWGEALDALTKVVLTP